MNLKPGFKNPNFKGFVMPEKYDARLKGRNVSRRERTQLNINVHPSCAVCLHYVAGNCQQGISMTPVEKLAACPLGRWEKPHVV